MISKDRLGDFSDFGVEIRISAGQLLLHFQQKIQRSSSKSIFGGILFYLTLLVGFLTQLRPYQFRYLPF